MSRSALPSKKLWEATKYRTYRPVYPENLLCSILEKTKNTRIYIDVGCGTGQLTQQLSPYFCKSLGIDKSPDMIKNAPVINNTEFIEGQADLACLGSVEKSSVDLITAAQMAHWLTNDKMKLNAFTESAIQFLAPRGIVCIVGYRVPLPRYNILRMHVSELYDKTLRENLWDPRCDRRAIDTAMSEVDFSPLQKCSTEWFHETRSMPLHLYLNYIATMSAIVAHPELHTNLVKEVKEEAPWLFASDARDQVIDYSFFMVSLCK